MDLNEAWYNAVIDKDNYNAYFKRYASPFKDKQRENRLPSHRQERYHHHTIQIAINKPLLDVQIPETKQFGKIEIRVFCMYFQYENMQLITIATRHIILSYTIIVLAQAQTLISYINVYT